MNTLVSNCDRVIDREVEADLRERRIEVAEYPGWDFYALVHFREGQFVATVKRYGAVVGEVSEPTVDALIVTVSDRFGWG